MRTGFVFLGFWLLIVEPAFGGSLNYRFSFGQELLLDEDPRRVELSITNESDQHIDCEIASLLDGASPDPVKARVGFLTVAGQDDCIGGSCLILISPPPKVAMFMSVGPFDPGETKTCAFDVSVISPFTGTITLSGSAGPIEVRAAEPAAVPAMGYFAMAFLSLAMLAAVCLRLVR